MSSPVMSAMNAFSFVSYATSVLIATSRNASKPAKATHAVGTLSTMQFQVLISRSQPQADFPFIH